MSETTDLLAMISMLERVKDKARNKFFDIGTATGTIDIQEHAVYLGSADCMVLGNLIYDIPNGFGIQMYNGGSAINFEPDGALADIS